ncbi:hypothetical protein AEAC466_12155 [Asticcacaulis sp. AC466]|nr:hypothetical protein AEAC466_12155 [Asticcacaulis sp. AC466]
MQTLDHGSICYGNEKAGWRKLTRADVTFFMDGHAGYYPKFTVLQNFLYFASMGNPDLRFKTKEEAELWLDRVGILSARNSPSQTLSKGMLQRLNIAIALSCNSKILLLDEPTLGLDIVGSAELCALIKKLTVEHSLITIFTSHEPDAIISISDEISVICKGEVRRRFDSAETSKLSGVGLVEAYLRLVGGGSNDERH